jgi:hypothetical protein
MRRWTSALSRTEIVWISVLIVLGLTSAAFAFAAQATRVKVVNFLSSSLSLFPSQHFFGCILL